MIKSMLVNGLIAVTNLKEAINYTMETLILLGLLTVRQQMSVAFSNKISAFLNTHLNNMY